MALATFTLDPDALVTGEDVRDALKSVNDKDRGFVLTRPVSGQFPIIACQRNTTGELELEYDDVAIP